MDFHENQDDCTCGIFEQLKAGKVISILLKNTAVPIQLTFQTFDKNSGCISGFLRDGRVFVVSCDCVAGVFLSPVPPLACRVLAYVTNTGDNTVSVVDTATNTTIDTISVGEFPVFVALTPNGRRAYVTNLNSNTVSVMIHSRIM